MQSRTTRAAIQLVGASNAPPIARDDTAGRRGDEEWVRTSLIAKLTAAQQSLARCSSKAGANQLMAFANKVRALKRTHTLAADQADLWAFEVDNILVTMAQMAIMNQQMTGRIRSR